MTPSLRSHPNHPQPSVSPPSTRGVGGNGYRSCSRLRLSLGGSPPLKAESGSLSFGTAGPPRAALHPVSRRRSCLRLLSRSSSRDDSDFHWLISCMCIRTRAMRPRSADSTPQVYASTDRCRSALPLLDQPIRSTTYGQDSPSPMHFARTGFFRMYLRFSAADSHDLSR